VTAQPPVDAAVVVSDLSVVRGDVEALRGVSLTVQRGTVTGLLGPSGGGKSTLMRCLVGVQIVRSGDVAVLGLPAGSPELRHRVGYLTQSPSVYPDLTARENLGYFAAVLGAPPGDVDRVLAEVDLVDAADRVVSRMSGGQHARVSLAVTLLGAPEVLVLDEPTVGLDPVLRADLWSLFHSLADRGVTLLVSSHVMDEATRCDRLLLVREGDLIADASLPELLVRTASETVEEAFLKLVGANPAEWDGDR
jgi:ABC-2 type transport system ATP-binding protein